MNLLGEIINFIGISSDVDFFFIFIIIEIVVV